MNHYIQVIDRSPTGVNDVFWREQDGKAWRIDVQSDEPLPIPLGLDPGTFLTQRHPGSIFYKLDLAPGQYHSRMARPSTTDPRDSPGSNPATDTKLLHSLTESSGQLVALIERLQNICTVVQPVAENYNVFGHEIRNLLILACTECEAFWKAILDANGKKGSNTRDYAHLAEPMKLAEYEVVLTYYPWIEGRNPFQKWLPWQSNAIGLPWYHAYNKVKHDRERDFKRATLIHAIDAVTACFVMICAQRGWDFAYRGEMADRAFFKLTEAPKWKPFEIYVPAFNGDFKHKDCYFPSWGTDFRQCFADG